MLYSYYQIRFPYPYQHVFNSIHYNRIGKEYFMFRQLNRQSATRTSQQTVNTISSGLSHQDTTSLMQFWHPVHTNSCQTASLHGACGRFKKGPLISFSDEPGFPELLWNKLWKPLSPQTTLRRGKKECRGQTLWPPSTQTGQKR